MIAFDPEAVELAHRSFDFARQAGSASWSPLAGAIFKGEDAVIDALLAAGADPHAGTPSAAETATFFGRHELAQRLSS